MVSSTMVGSASLEISLVLAGLFLLASVLASKASAKLGIPALVLFLILGMLAGSDGPGRLHFDDIALTKTLGSVALALILFAGGLDTPWSEIKPVIWKAISLATLGVALTAGAVALFAHYFIGLPILSSFLLGAIVSSTDAAAVFSVLRTGNIKLKHRLGPILEAESGSNDAMAVFLTVSIITLATTPGTTVLGLIPSFLLQMPVGLGIGLLGGYAAVWLINRIRLEYDGLYPAITLAVIFLVFGGAHLLHGNEFLAVYAAGVVMGSRTFLHKIALVQFHDGLAWLMQIAMFLALGLLVYPSQLLPLAASGLALALFLLLVARPVAVFISLFFARKLKRRDKVFLSWAGLRGAVPIILATFPRLAGVEGSELIFNLVFFIVLTSVAVQGTLMTPIGKRLGVITVPRAEAEAAAHENILEVLISKDSPAVNRQVVELNLPRTALLVLLKRRSESYIPKGATVLKSGDKILVATRRDDHEELRRMLEGDSSRPVEPPDSVPRK